MLKPTPESLESEDTFVLSSGQVLPLWIRGAADDDDAGDGDDGDNGDGDDHDDDDDGEDEGNKEPKTFTQEEVNRIMSKEKKDGRRAGKAKLLEDLGVSSLEEARSKMSSPAKSKDDGEGKPTESDTSEQEKRAMQAERKQMKIVGRAERSLIRAGAPDDDRTLAGLVVMLDLDSDSDADDITTAVEELKDSNPALFGTTGTGTPPGTDPGRGKKRAKPASKDAAGDLMKARHG